MGSIMKLVRAMPIFHFWARGGMDSGHITCMLTCHVPSALFGVVLLVLAQLRILSLSIVVISWKWDGMFGQMVAAKKYKLGLIKC